MKLDGDSFGSNFDELGVKVDDKRNAAKDSRIEEYCRVMGGSRPIRSVLIANNGIAAVKFIKSVRSWSYETFGVERAVLLVAMATTEDMRVSAEHIRMADQFVEVPGGTNNNNYANVQLIVEVAERTGVDAVWPGWGHASENPELPDALEKRNIVFLGPPSAPMAALGDKVGSSIIAQAALVPCLPWSGSGVTFPFEECRDPIPDEVYQKACVHTTEEALVSCNKIGYPVMIKASWGGGGKGIRKVFNDEEVKALFRQVQGEVPGSPIFIMKVAAQSRHLEVQLLCDQHGNVTALHSRDCSIQRRHQKVVEEGPITVAPPATIRELERGACRLAKCVGYEGVATVEYLYSMETNEFFFLELNPRLQVEHPVTEWIAGVNLPASQLAVGMGIPLWRLPEVRRLFGKKGGGSNATWKTLAEEATPFSFEDAVQTEPKGHVVAVRVTSEDPDDGFKPTSGRVQELIFRGKPDVWAYFSIKSGGGIHEFSDSQFGHLFAFGETRSAAIANMVITLKELQIRGEIRTNIDYAVDLLHATEYKENRFHTGWLDSRIAMRVRAERPPWHVSVIAGALHTGVSLTAARVSEYIGYLEKGQIPPKTISLVNFEASMNIDGSKYVVSMTKKGPHSYRLRLNNSEVAAEGHTLRDGGLLVQLDGKSHMVYAETEANGTRLLIDGRTCLLQNDQDPSKLVAETPCKLLRYLVEDGGHVGASMAYAEVEVMKMCMPLLVPMSGTLHHALQEGEAMAAGDLIARVDLDDPSAVKTATLFTGTFPPLGMPTAVGEKANLRCAAAVNAASMVLAGYEHDVDAVVESLLHCLDDPWLPLLQWRECMAVLATRMPKGLKSKLDAQFRAYETDFVAAGGSYVKLPAKAFLATMEEEISSKQEGEQASLQQSLAPLLSLAHSYEGGREGHARSIVQKLFNEYLRVEELFSESPQADVIEGMRQLHKKDLARVVDVVLSHQGIRHKNKLILRLMVALVLPNPAPYREHLLQFATLSHSTHAEVALRSSQLLEHTKLSELRASIARALSELEMFAPAEEKPSGQNGADEASLRLPNGALGPTSPGGGCNSTPGLSGRPPLEERMRALVDAPVAVEDALASMLSHSDPTLQSRAIETYVRRLYQPYLVKDTFQVRATTGLTVVATWQFWEETPPPAALRGNKPMSPPRVAGHAGVAVKRWGAMLVVPYLSSIPPALQHAFQEIIRLEKRGLQQPPTSLPSPTGGGLQRADSISGTPSGGGNVVHVALLAVPDRMKGSLDSGDEDHAEERVSQLGSLLERETTGEVLRGAEVGEVGCILLRDEGRSPTRHCFRWSATKEKFEEQPLLRHVEPPLSNLLELEKLRDFVSVRYAPSRDRQWHMYSTTERPANIRRMFLRALIRPMVSSPPLHAKRQRPHSAENLPSVTITRTSSASALLSTNAANSPPKTVNLTGGVGAGGGLARISTKGGQDRATVDTIASAISSALEELELSAHEASGRADHAQLFLSALKGLELHAHGPDSPKFHAGGPAEDEALRGVLEEYRLAVAILRELALEVDRRHGRRMRQLAVAEWEARLKLRSPGGASRAWRVVVSNPSGHAAIINVYREAVEAANGEAVYFSPYDPPKGPLHSTPLAQHYKPLGLLEKKRLMARKQSTTYCYDFVGVFEAALAATWAKARQEDSLLSPLGPPFLHAKEMVFPNNRSSDWGTELIECERRPGENKIGMVGWRVDMVTPECPGGRSIFIVSNDCTHGAGAFGPPEDHYFMAAVEYARSRGIPLIYLAANSGARIGVAEEVRACFRVGWAEEKSPDKGFRYLYVTPEDHQRIEGSICAEELRLPSGEIRWVITDIIGREDGLGVENLSGSGAIASAYARAYWETFTLTFVTGRTVGIGAYLARLGIRCIQRLDQPIILTGFSALNKLLGREVYSSHMQLGGPKIMATNGVVHQTVENDLEGAMAILKWLSYVPAHMGGPLPITRALDPIHRPIEYLPDTSCDPRAAIRGVLADSGTGGACWRSGLFDHGSFTETLEGWAQTVVVGRARLGGIPVGVVAVETQAVSQCIPADPGQPDTTERMVAQAGQVWFPDSAAKTAQALQDFNSEGLPLFILANWRGFSGGQRDLFEGVLQRGSLIVDNLRRYSRPVFVYIPRMGELRGGAWVVVDSKINPDMVEMYADTTARGAVLEPEGMVEIKFRSRELVEAMHRLDPVLQDLDRQAKEQEPAQRKSRRTDAPATTSLVAQQIRDQEKRLMPVFKQVAIRFAELHDTPRRMEAKGVIRKVVPWEHARAFFYRRLSRRLAEEELVLAIQKAVNGTSPGSSAAHGSAAMPRSEALKLLHSWFEADSKASIELGMGSRTDKGVPGTPDKLEVPPPRLGAEADSVPSPSRTEPLPSPDKAEVRLSPHKGKIPVTSDRLEPAMQSKSPPSVERYPRRAPTPPRDPGSMRDAEGAREKRDRRVGGTGGWGDSSSTAEPSPGKMTIRSLAVNVHGVWDEDLAFVAWARSGVKIESRLQGLHAERVAREIKAAAARLEGQQGLLQGLSEILQTAKPEDRKQLAMDINAVIAKALAE